MDDLNKRYFLIFFESYDYGKGYSCSITNGEFINCNRLIDKIKSDFGNDSSIAITNILELNKKDYESWIA